MKLNNLAADLYSHERCWQVKWFELQVCLCDFNNFKCEMAVFRRSKEDVDPFFASRSWLNNAPLPCQKVKIRATKALLKLCKRQRLFTKLNRRANGSILRSSACSNKPNMRYSTRHKMGTVGPMR